MASYPAFTPALVVWFAALFGLSVVAIRGSLLESWVLGAQLDLVVPAAAPPLGMVARLLLALMFAALGAAIGWVAARLLRPRNQDSDGGFQLRSRDRHPDHPARRPISAHAELGDEGLGRADAAYAYDHAPAEPYPVETFRSAYASPAPLTETAALDTPLIDTAVVEAVQPLPFAVELPPVAPFTDEPFLEDQPQEALPIGASVAALPVFATQPALTAPAMATGHNAVMPEILPPLAQGEFVPPLLPAQSMAPLMEPGAVPPFMEPAALAPIAYPPPPPAAPVSDTPAVPYPAPAWEHEPQHAAHDAGLASDETAIPVITPFPLLTTPQPAADHAAADTQEPWHSLPPLVSDSDLEQQAHLRAIAPPVPAPVSPPPSASVTPIRPRVHLATAGDLPAPVEPEAEEEAPARDDRHEAMIGATPVQPRSHNEERIGQAALDDLSHVELIERLALAMKKRDDQAAEHDDAPIPLPLRATPQGRALAAQVEELAGTQASLRSALAALREVK